MSTYLVAGICFATVFAVIGLILAGRALGRSEARAEDIKKRLDAIKEKDRIDEQVNQMGHADVEDRFRRWGHQ